MRARRLAWPGIALTITFVDDLVAGPILVAIGALVPGAAGIALGVLVFTCLVGALVASVILAGPVLDPAVQKRVDEAVASAGRRRFIGRHVRKVGDDHPLSTAFLATAVSPVVATLLARVLHPSQALVRTGVIASVSYGLIFSLFYYGLGSGVATVTGSTSSTLLL